VQCEDVYCFYLGLVDERDRYAVQYMLLYTHLGGYCNSTCTVEESGNSECEG
jgi:hypothetical protein